MNILKKYLREKGGEVFKTKTVLDRQEYLTRIKQNQACINRLRERFVGVVKTLNERDEEVQGQNSRMKIND